MTGACEDVEQAVSPAFISSFEVPELTEPSDGLPDHPTVSTASFATFDVAQGNARRGRPGATQAGIKLSWRLAPLRLKRSHAPAGRPRDGASIGRLLPAMLGRAGRYGVGFQGVITGEAEIIVRMHDR
jgi:hypothetical protein